MQMVFVPSVIMLFEGFWKRLLDRIYLDKPA